MPVLRNRQNEPRHSRQLPQLDHQRHLGTSLWPPGEHHGQLAQARNEPALGELREEVQQQRDPDQGLGAIVLAAECTEKQAAEEGAVGAETVPGGGKEVVAHDVHQDDGQVDGGERETMIVDRHFHFVYAYAYGDPSFITCWFLWFKKQTSVKNTIKTMHIITNYSLINFCLLFISDILLDLIRLPRRIARRKMIILPMMLPWTARIVTVLAFAEHPAWSLALVTLAVVLHAMRFSAFTSLFDLLQLEPQAEG